MNSTPDTTNKDKRPAVTVKSTPNKSKKFGRNSSPGSPGTPGSSNSNDSLVTVTLIKPTTGSKTAMAGMVITPKGFLVDKHLAGILTKKADDNPKTKTFLEKTGVIPFVIYARDENGKTVEKLSRGTFYPISSCFIPLDEEELTDKKLIETNVRKVAYWIHKLIRDDLPSYYENKKSKGADEMPVIKDWDSEVRTVSTFSEAISDRKDSGPNKALYMTLHLSLKSGDNTLKDWLNVKGDDNIYSIFPAGNVDFEWFKKYNLPYECLNNEDKASFKTWCDDKKKAKKEASGDDDGEDFDAAKFFGFEEE